MIVTAARPGAGWRVMALLAGLPLFLQSFHYIVDLPPLYLLSKAWPLLTLPLALLGAMQQPQLRLLLLGLLAYVLLLPPAMTMLYFGQSYPAALTGVVKVLPFTYFFSVLWCLRRLRPEPAELQRAFILLGWASLGLLALLWLVVPDSAYRSGAIGEEVSKLFLWDPERGNRITLPLVFGIIGIFLQARLGLRRGQWARLAMVAASVLLLVLVYKQRTVIGCIVLLLGYVLFMEVRPPVRVALGYVALVLTGFGLIWSLIGELPFSATGLGGSLSARQITISLALDFLAENPLRWLFGVGALTRASDITFQQWFSHPNFYLVDIGWLGVVFEYGLVGALLLLAVYLYTLREGSRTPAPPSDGLVPALSDYARFLLLSSPVLSVVWAPGEVCTLLAIFVYLRSRPNAP